MQRSPQKVEWQVERFEEIDSTNRWLADQCRAGAPAGLVAIAAEQSAGRGRLDRSWIAEKNSALLMSILLRPTEPPEQWHLNTFRVALACLDAIDPLLPIGVGASVKWPNDVMVSSDGREAKLAGILAEAVLPTPTQPGGVIVGIGCNITRPALVPPEIAARATWLSDVGVLATRDELANALLTGLTDLLDLDPPSLIDRLRQRSSSIGRTVRVELPNDVLEGVAETFDNDAALLVRDMAGTLHTVRLGDVIHLR